MSDGDDKPQLAHIPLDGLTPDELRARLSRALHAVGALQRLTFALKELVPKAFEEGFRMRAPDTEEPWLIDWLQSESRRALEPLLAGMAPRPAPRDPDQELS
jgi:hypothetical protein